MPNRGPALTHADLPSPQPPYYTYTQILNKIVCSRNVRGPGAASHSAPLTLEKILIPLHCQSYMNVQLSTALKLCKDELKSVDLLVHAGICSKRGSGEVEHLDFICARSAERSRNRLKKKKVFFHINCYFSLLFRSWDSQLHMGMWRFHIPCLSLACVELRVWLHVPAYGVRACMTRYSPVELLFPDSRRTIRLLDQGCWIRATKEKVRSLF